MNGGTPTEYEKSTLRYVTASIPLMSWFVVIIEAAERFTYFGLSGPLRTYMTPSLFEMCE
ncbi:L-fuculose-phosphate aldolase [Purpureocillium lavendulum]|uniref:L-fuculose-phosphate aldolase n=1 Tax=Purpureocillium lavendulum TaxID=1247861 RepID=A0AB34FHT4_9HYPO|nr:L-fuculose-phosphate aldolase [Purpureocillium lavendulum]